MTHTHEHFHSYPPTVTHSLSAWPDRAIPLFWGLNDSLLICSVILFRSLISHGCFFTFASWRCSYFCHHVGLEGGLQGDRRRMKPVMFLFLKEIEMFIITTFLSIFVTTDCSPIIYVPVGKIKRVKWTMTQCFFIASTLRYIPVLEMLKCWRR